MMGRTGDMSRGEGVVERVDVSAHLRNVTGTSKIRGCVFEPRVGRPILVALGFDPDWSPASSPLPVPCVRLPHRLPLTTLAWQRVTF
ncbi:hypothetical protein E2C01_000274 [Portunus trituberculatus]|uniref:Uncharacterized protein n=1 Tax=Portunus trituberculatus TaxID=210409 RepID=A0A5B7CDV6_PORTR|nr:hypothetical protein [Portunus trituberculatus]